MVDLLLALLLQLGLLTGGVNQKQKDASATNSTTTTSTTTTTTGEDPTPPATDLDGGTGTWDTKD